MDGLSDFTVALHHGGIPHVVAGAVHMGHSPVLVGQIEVALRVVAHGNGDGCCAVLCHVGIEFPRLLQGEALQGALGAHHTVFQRHIAELKGGEQKLVGVGHGFSSCS